MKAKPFRRTSPTSQAALQDSLEVDQLTTPLFAPLVMGRKLGFAVSAKPGLLGVTQVTEVMQNVVSTGCGLAIDLQAWLLRHEAGFGIPDLLADGYKPDQADTIILRLEEIGYIDETARPESSDTPKCWMLSSRGREMVRGYSFDDPNTTIQ